MVADEGNDEGLVVLTEFTEGGDFEVAVEGKFAGGADKACDSEGGFAVGAESFSNIHINVLKHNKGNRET